MPGRPDFSQAGSEGSGQTVAVTERPELKTVTANQTGSVSKGTEEVVELYAPAGSVYEVFNLLLVASADADAAAGNHVFEAAPMNGRNALRGGSNFDTDLDFRAGVFLTADDASATFPQNATSQTMMMQALRATENNPLVFRYENNLDVAQENQRNIEMQVEEVSY